MYFDGAHAAVETYRIARICARPRGLILPARPDYTRPGPHNLLVAEGSADIHVQTGKDENFHHSSGHSWDNAADHVIVINSGGMMVQIHRDDKGSITAAPLKFDTVRGKMPAYMTFGDQALCMKTFPELKR